MDERKKVLIVEDEALTALALETYIQERGFRSAGLSATGEEAVLKARSERPDLILMDFMLGGPMSGIEAARMIDADRRTPIVIISGYAESIILERASGYRPWAILRKPLGEAEIDGVLNSIV